MIDLIIDKNLNLREGKYFLSNYNFLLKVSISQKNYFNKFFKKKILKINYLNKFNFKLLNTSFGNIKLLDLLNDNVSYLIYFLLLKKKSYDNILDVGANVGVHSVIFNKLGFNVVAIEPDPNHFKKLKKNINLNNLKNIFLKNVALSNKNGLNKFYQVKNNTTGNHIVNSKAKPYGPKKIIKVKTLNATNFLEKADFVKMDCEGQEAEIFKCLLKVKKIPDILFEIHDKNKAKKIYIISKKLKLNLFSQKNMWKEVTKFNYMPFNNKEGLVFCSINKKIFLT